MPTPLRSGTLAFALIAFAATGRAESDEVRGAAGDVYELSVQSHTYLELYRRALLPGPSGALVVTETVAPLYEYVALRAQGLDLPFRRDGLAVELNAWGRLDLAEPEGTQRLDGELGSANVRYSDEHVWVKLGRQHFAGGAARYVRFDGASAGAELDVGIGAEAYTGFSVVAPSYRRRGYQLLGAAPDSLVRDPGAYDGDERASSWLAGARAYYERPWSHGVALSFHEQQRSGELERRNLGADAHAALGETAEVAVSSLLDVDSLRLADVRAWSDVYLADELDLNVEYLHTEPALFLSRQSVLSVFSTEQFEEIGGRLTLRVHRDAEFGGGAHLHGYDDGELGSRGELRTRFRPEGDARTLVSLAYVRVVAPRNGYHSARLALRRQLWRPLAASGEAHLYLYDQAILGYSSSSVGAASLEWAAGGGFGLLWGASLARSPYARLDAQTLVRLSYESSVLGGQR